MNKLSLAKKTISTIIILASFFIYTIPIVSAQTGRTALPEAAEDCTTFDKYDFVINAYNPPPKDNAADTTTSNSAEIDPRIKVANDFKTWTRSEQYQVIGCTLKSGRFHLFMVPYMIRYFVELIIGLSGLICTLFIVIGAYQYMLGSVTENKQKGKDTIQNALIGLTITLLSWVIANIVMVAVTKQ